MINAVIFDMDGVIADSHSAINKLFTDVLNKHLNLNLTVEDFSKYPGMRFEHRAEIFAKQKGIKISLQEIDKIIDIGREEYYHNSLNFIRMYPGTKELFDALKKAGIKIGLGTNGSRRSITKIIEQFKIKDYFSSIVTYDDATHGKPHPEIFLKNAKNLGVIPEECVVIEDSIEGIKAAKAAGMKVIAVSTTLLREELKEADMIVESIKDLNIEKIRTLE